MWPLVPLGDREAWSLLEAAAVGIERKGVWRMLLCASMEGFAFFTFKWLPHGSTKGTLVSECFHSSESSVFIADIYFSFGDCLAKDHLSA